MILPLATKQESDKDKHKYIITIKIPSLEVQPTSSASQAGLHSKQTLKSENISFAKDINIHGLSICSSYITKKHLEGNLSNSMSNSANLGGSTQSSAFDMFRTSSMYSYYRTRLNSSNTSAGSKEPPFTTIAASIEQSHHRHSSQEYTLLCPCYVYLNVWGYKAPKSADVVEDIIGMKCHIRNLEFLLNESQLDYITNAVTLLKQRTISFQSAVNNHRLWLIVAKYFRWKIFNFECERYYAKDEIDAQNQQADLSSSRRRRSVSSVNSNHSGNNTHSLYTSQMGNSNPESNLASYYSEAGYRRYKWRHAIYAVCRLIRMETGRIAVSSFNHEFTSSLSKHYSSIYKRLLLDQMIQPPLNLTWYVNKVKTDLRANSYDNVYPPEAYTGSDIRGSHDTDTERATGNTMLHNHHSSNQYFFSNYYLDLSVQEVQTKLQQCHEIFDSKDMLVSRVKIHLYFLNLKIPVVYLRQAVAKLNSQNEAPSISWWQRLLGGPNPVLSKFQGE